MVVRLGNLKREWGDVLVYTGILQGRDSHDGWCRVLEKLTPLCIRKQSRCAGRQWRFRDSVGIFQAEVGPCGATNLLRPELWISHGSKDLVVSKWVCRAALRAHCGTRSSSDPAR